MESFPTNMSNETCKLFQKKIDFALISLEDLGHTQRKTGEMGFLETKHNKG